MTDNRQYKKLIRCANALTLGSLGIVVYYAEPYINKVLGNMIWPVILMLVAQVMLRGKAIRILEEEKNSLWRKSVEPHLSHILGHYLEFLKHHKIDIHPLFRYSDEGNGEEIANVDFSLSEDKSLNVILKEHHISFLDSQRLGEFTAAWEDAFQGTLFSEISLVFVFPDDFDVEAKFGVE